jgi:thiamine-phosphate pyrophosphorylase
VNRPGGVVVVTDRRQARGPLPEVVAAAVAGGARWVLLREKDLPRTERFALARLLRTVVAGAGRLIVAGPDPLDGNAVHLAAADPPGFRPDGVTLVGRSCHDSDELERMTSEDYATVSPVFASDSKPGYGPALGVDRLRALCLRSRRPVVALGGVQQPEQAAACVAAGAAGVAVMGAVMRSPDPAATVAAFGEAVAAGAVEGSTK